MYRSNNQVLLFLALAYIGWYFYYLHRYIVDMPYIDDYDAILGYILQFENAGFWTKVQSLLLPHSEHIMAMTRLVSWCNVALTDTIDFYGLIIIGNGLLLWQLWLLYTLFRTSKNIPSVYFLLVILIFLNPQYSPTSFWAMALWSNIWVLIPVTLSIFFLSNPKTWFWALPMALLALFGNGNGLFIWPVGLAILFLAKRPLFQYMVWGITGGIFCSIYFYLMRQQPSSGMFELSHLPMVPLNILAFVGAYFALVSGKLGQTIAILAGTSILILGFFTLKKYLATKQKTDLILLSLLVFIFLTALAVALFRAEKGMGIIIGGRYRQYSSLAVGIGFLIAFRHFPLKGKSRIQLLLWVAVSTITCLSFFRDVGLRRATEERTVADYHNILHNGIDVYTTTGTPRFVKTAREARQLAIYMAPPKYDLTTHLKVAAPDSLKQIEKVQYIKEFKADGVTCGNHWLLKEANLSLPPDGALYLVLSHEQTNIIFPASSTRNDIITMLKQQQYFKNGVEAEAYDCAQSLKDFQVNWLKVSKQPVLYHTNTTIFTR